MPEYEPVEVYFPTNGGGDARFGQDLTDEEARGLQLGGWLALT